MLEFADPDMQRNVTVESIKTYFGILEYESQPTPSSKINLISRARKEADVVFVTSSRDFASRLVDDESLRVTITGRAFRKRTVAHAEEISSHAGSTFNIKIHFVAEEGYV